MPNIKVRSFTKVKVIGLQLSLLPSVGREMSTGQCGDALRLRIKAAVDFVRG